MNSLNLAVIGNCSFSALLDERARIVWSCLPRFDSDPVFSALINDEAGRETGFFDIVIEDFARAEQRYRKNSAVVVTRLYDTKGNGIEITDFAPRFKQFERPFRPLMIIRRVRPLRGDPLVRVRLRPTYGYGARRPETTRGSNHIRYVIPGLTLRLTTDAPVTYVLEEVTFVLNRPLTLILGGDESMTQPVADLAESFEKWTDAYWREWCRYLALPFEWQDAVIRAAITLKLSNFEESGAIVAAMTTSIPEGPDTARNWDYRYCWLRDAFFVVRTLNRLGVTKTMERFLDYINDIVARSTAGALQPVFDITLGAELDEREVACLAGYRGMGPVRVGNQAYRQVQNDGYGSVILASAQSFFDQRLMQPGDEALFARLERLGEEALARWDSADAGLWELRTRAGVHTFSSVMCWAALDRLAIIARILGRSERSRYWRRHAERLKAAILKRAWNDEKRSFVARFDGGEVDASLLLLPELGLLPADDPRALATLARIEQKLLRGGYMFRYATPDDFGTPETAFIICTFWYIDALASAGRVDEARELFEHMLSCRNSLGLLAEDIDPHTGELWGNFPQTYSMVGLINSAMRLSRPWERAF